MADRTVTVRLKVNDDFSVSIDRYNAKMQSAEHATKKAADSTKSFGDKVKGLDNQLGILMGGAAFGFGMSKVIGLAEGLYAAGQNAQRAGMLFESFSGQVGDTTALLERLRVTTRGVVDDTTLMQSASTQLSMGLARNADDVERLTNIGVTFAQAMGQDIQSSMENLNLLLANQSYLRLDTLGISSSQVRELAGQYRQAGMDSSEAFTAAFMDVAEQKLPQMAQVADATVTEIQKLQAAMDNWWSDFGERFAQGVNGLIGIATHAGPIIQAALWGNTNVQADMAVASNPQLSTLAAYFAPSTRQFFGGPAATIAAAGLNTGVNPRDMTDAFLSEVLGAGSLGEAQNRTAAEIAERVIRTFRSTSGVTYGPYTGGAADWSQFGPRPWSMPGTMGLPPYMQDIMGWQRTGERADYSFLSIMSQYDQTMRALDAERIGLQTGAGRRTLFSAEEAAHADRIADQMEMIAARAVEISDSPMVDTMSAAAEYARDWADYTKQGADTLAGMNLAQVMGQTGGGRLGELTDLATAALAGAGIAEGITAGFENQLDLISGRETATSLWMEKNFGPMVVDVVEQYGTEAGTAFVQSVNAAIDYAGATKTPFDPATMLPYMYQPGSAGPGGDPYTIQPGDTLSAIAAQRGMTVAELAAINGISNPGMIVAGQTLNFGTGGTLIPNKGFTEYEMPNPLAEAEISATNISDTMKGAGDELATAVEGVFSKEYSLQLAVKAVDTAVPQWLKDLIKAELVTLVQGNGGVTPGTTNYGTRGGGTGARPGFVVTP